MAKGEMNKIVINSEIALDLWKQGKSDREIGTALGLDGSVKDRIRRWRRMMGLPPNEYSKDKMLENLERGRQQREPEPVTARQRTRRETSMDRIARITREARERGMSYGEYVSKYGGYGTGW